jgi:hypothetical protein
MKTKLEKKYAPVTPFERQTSHCPLYIAWLVLDEARDYFRTNWVPSPGARTRKTHLIRPVATFSPSDAEKADLLDEELADKLAQRAEMVFANHPFWQRKFQSAAGREHLLAVMRHWLAGVLAQEQPALFRALPDSYKVGAPLPPQPLNRPKKIRKRNPPARPFKHFVHGCELLAA